MAGDWIKIEHALPDKPEVMEMATELGIDPDAIVGKLIRIWTWFDNHTDDGNANVTVRALLNRYTGVTNFVTAMENVGWIAESNGRLILNHFDRHNGQTAKNRVNTNRRVAKSRACNARSVTDVTPPPLQKPLPEKRREDIKKEFPISLDTDAFRAAWENWKEYRKQANLKAWSPMTENAQLKKFSAMGAVNAMTAIETSIRMGWQGVFEQKPVKKDSFTSADVGLGRNFTSAEVGI